MTLEVGVIGTGTWGKNYVRILNELESVNLKKIADIEESSLKKLSGTYNVGWTTDYKDLLSDKDITAVCVCSPASTHYTIVKDCLIAKKHVLVEKPIAVSSKEGEELARIAKEQDRILMVGHVFRFNPGVLRLKEEIKKGTFGKIRFIYGSRMGLMTPRNDCGVITDFALHDFDTFCFLLDAYPKEVTAVASSYNNSGFEDVGFCTLKFEDNIIANIGVSWLTPKKVRDLWVIGEKCSASLDYLSQVVEIYNKGIVPEYDSFGEFKLLTKQEGDCIKPFIPVKEPLKEEISHFLDCVITQKKPFTSSAIGIKVVKIIEACYRSLRKKSTIMVDID